MTRLMMALGAAVLGAALAGPAPAAPGDAVQGKVVFAKCMACHQVVAGKNGIGPTLFQVSGRKAGTLPGYTYSPAMKASGLVWTPAALDTYLAKPMAKVPGTKMIFMGVPNPADRANLIAYLATLK